MQQDPADEFLQAVAQLLSRQAGMRGQLPKLFRRFGKAKPLELLAPAKLVAADQQELAKVGHQDQVIPFPILAYLLGARDPIQDILHRLGFDRAAFGRLVGNRIAG